jgi:hypothetical protein
MCVYDFYTAPSVPNKYACTVGCNDVADSHSSDSAVIKRNYDYIIRLVNEIVELNYKIVRLEVFLEKSSHDEKFPYDSFSLIAEQRGKMLEYQDVLSTRISIEISRMMKANDF